MKSFLTPKTGKIVEYPDHFAALKPYLIEITGTGDLGGLTITDPTATDAQGLMALQVDVPIIGGVVLVDPSTELAYTYSLNQEVDPTSWTLGMLGGIVLIDPATNEPYRYG